MQAQNVFYYMKKIFLLILLGIIICVIECYAQKFNVKVVKISDGDTFVGINSDNLQLKFRIWGIDAPEKKQAYGTKAKDFLSSLIFGKTITVDVQKQDGWGRYLTYVYTPDGKDVSLEMIKNGYAWHYVKYDNTEEYNAAELNAKKNKVGLWVDPKPIAPWDFR